MNCCAAFCRNSFHLFRRKVSAKRLEALRANICDFSCPAVKTFRISGAVNILTSMRGGVSIHLRRVRPIRLGVFERVLVALVFFFEDVLYCFLLAPAFAASLSRPGSRRRCWEFALRRATDRSIWRVHSGPGTAAFQVFHSLPPAPAPRPARQVAAVGSRRRCQMFPHCAGS